MNVSDWQALYAWVFIAAIGLAGWAAERRHRAADKNAMRKSARRWVEGRDA